LYSIFRSFNSNFCGAGNNIRRLLDPKMLGTEVDLLGGVYCMCKFLSTEVNNTNEVVELKFLVSARARYV